MTHQDANTINKINRTHNLIRSLGSILTTIDLGKIVEEYNLNENEIKGILEELTNYYDDHDAEGNYIGGDK